MVTARALAIALVPLVAACELFVDIPSPNTGDDAPDAAVQCTSSTQCAAPTPVCDVQGGTCVECLTGAECLDPAEPACGADHTCGPCVDDGECASEVCLVDGTCASATRILYASPDGIGPACTAADPCTVDVAITLVTPATDVIKLRAGIYDRAASLQIQAPMTIAGTGATFRSQLGGGFESLLTVAADLVLIGLSTEGSMLNSSLICNGGTNLGLHHVTFTGGAYGASSACNLVADDLTITGMAFYAMSAGQAQVTITNSLFAHNGGQSVIGGLYLFEVTGGVIEHNTIADNSRNDGVGGLACVDTIGAIIQNNIIWNNQPPGIDPNCTVTTSIVELDYLGGSGNAAMDPLFTAPLVNDYHLQPTSPAIGLGNPASTLDHDFDRQPRPQPSGTNPDAGADESP